MSIWQSEDVQWVKRHLMPYFGIKDLRLATDDSTKRWPDLWSITGSPPSIVVTREWSRQGTHERRKRLVHEALHIARGLSHGLQPNGLNYSTYPKNDKYSMAVYQAMLRGDHWTRNPLNPQLLFTKKRQAYFSPNQYDDDEIQSLYGKSSIVIGKYPEYPEFQKSKPMVIAHEIGHSKDFKSSYGEVLNETKAWMWVLQKLPPKEINMKVLSLSLASHHIPPDIRDAIMNYARARKAGLENPTRADAVPILAALQAAGLKPRLVGSVAKKGRSDHDIDILLPFHAEGEANDPMEYPEYAAYVRTMKSLGFQWWNSDIYEEMNEEVDQWRKGTLVVDIFPQVKEGRENPTIKKLRSPYTSYGDRASQSYMSGHYGIYDGSKIVGYLQGSRVEYMGAARHWDVVSVKGKLIRTFYQPKAFEQAKAFALSYDWSKD